MSKGTGMKFIGGAGSMALVLLLAATVFAFSSKTMFSQTSTGNYSAVNSSALNVKDNDGDSASVQITEHNNVTTAVNLYGSNDGSTWWLLQSIGTAKANSTLTTFTPSAVGWYKLQANASGGIGNITAVLVTR